jgi:hypothetical protein
VQMDMQGDMNGKEQTHSTEDEGDSEDYYDSAEEHYIDCLDHLCGDRNSEPGPS